jgi:hypothetical protein
LFLLGLLDWPTEPLNPSERVIPNDLGYLDNPGPDSFFQLTDGHFRPSTKFCFLEKFEDDKSPEVLVMELSSLKMNPKEKIKDFNQRFVTLKNRIPTDSMPTENLIITYYTKALHQNITIWVKRYKKATLLEAFEEASQIEKNILSLKDNISNEVEITHLPRRK